MPEGSFHFQGALVFDGERFGGLSDIFVSDGRIVEDRPQNPVTIDAAGRCLLPGFIDSHVHIGFFEPRQVLRGGVTTARDLAWPPDDIFPLAQRLRDAPNEGPRLLAAGPMLTAKGGYPTSAGWAPAGTGWEVESPQEAADAVAAMARRGASVIKIAQEPKAGPVMPLATVKAVVEAAHSAGLVVTSHLGSVAELEVALEAGVDELAHGLWSDETIPSELVESMARSLTVVPTLHIDPMPSRIGNLRRFREAGGKVVYGTDMGNSGPPAGIDADEIDLMMKAGMSIEEALSSATSIAASYLGLDDVGRTAPGCVADLVLIEGDPRSDLRWLERVEAVMRQGVFTKRGG